MKKRTAGISLIVIGSAISVFGFLVMARMVPNFSHIISSLRMGDVSEFLAFLFFVFCFGGGIALIVIGRRLSRSETTHT